MFDSSLTERCDVNTSGRFPAIKGVCLVLVFAALVAAAPSPAAAAGPHDQFRQGVRVGETIPHLLNAADQEGRERSFRSLSGKRGLILLFNRSLDW